MKKRRFSAEQILAVSKQAGQVIPQYTPYSILPSKSETWVRPEAAPSKSLGRCWPRPIAGASKVDHGEETSLASTMPMSFS